MLEIARQLELNDLYVNKNFEALAEHPYIYLKPEWAMDLAKGKKSVRCSLANNPALAQLPEVAMKLVKDDYRPIRKILAYNPALPQLPDVAMELYKDKDFFIRQLGSQALAHPQTIPRSPLP